MKVYKQRDIVSFINYHLLMGNVILISLIGLLLFADYASAEGYKPKPPKPSEPQPIMVEQHQSQEQHVNVEGDTIHVDVPPAEVAVDNFHTIQNDIQNNIHAPAPTINQGDVFTEVIVGGNNSFVDSAPALIEVEGVSHSVAAVNVGWTRTEGVGPMPTYNSYGATLTLPITWGMKDTVDTAKQMQRYRLHLMKVNEARATQMHEMNMILSCVEMHKLGTLVKRGMAAFCTTISFTNDRHAKSMELNETHVKRVVPHHEKEKHNF